MKHNFYKTIVFLFSFVAITGFSFAQNDSHRLSEKEKAAMPAYLRNLPQHSPAGFTNPPSSAVRASAEWEEIDALIITWTSYTSILREIVRAAQTETKVIIVCSDSNTVKNSLTGSGIPLTNLQYIIAPFHTVWSRDYGPWDIYTD